MSSIALSHVGPLRRMVAAAAVFGASTLALGFMASPSDARIECKGPYQVIHDRLHATPYCEDNYLGAVAREYGMRITNAAIRHNPHEKQRACLFVGDDIRVRDICAGFRPDSGHKIF